MDRAGSSDSRGCPKPGPACRCSAGSQLIMYIRLQAPYNRSVASCRIFVSLRDCKRAEDMGKSPDESRLSRVAAAIAAGDTMAKIAERENTSLRTVQRWVKRPSVVAKI